MTIGAVAYGVLVFTAMAGLGFAVLPAAGLATGLFSIEAEARAFFSLLTLESVPFLFALSVLSALVWPRLRARSWPLRLGGFVSNVLVAYVLGVGLGALRPALGA